MSQRGELAVLVLCCVTSIVLVLLPDPTQIRVADHLGRVLTAPYWSARNFLDDMFFLRRENMRLHRELFSLDLERSHLDMLRGDAERAGVGVPVDGGGFPAPCRVTMRRRGRFTTMVRITSDTPLNWRPWLPVVNRQGMLGRVLTVVSPTAAWVELMSSPDFALGVEFRRTCLLGVLVPREDRYLVGMVGRDEDVRVGDEVVTSGVVEVKDNPEGLRRGAEAPRGILVGKVRAVAVPNDQVFKRIEIEPAASCNRNETVFVILPVQPGGRP